MIKNSPHFNSIHQLSYLCARTRKQIHFFHHVLALQLQRNDLMTSDAAQPSTAKATRTHYRTSKMEIIVSEELLLSDFYMNSKLNCAQQYLRDKSPIIVHTITTILSTTQTICSLSVGSYHEGVRVRGTRVVRVERGEGRVPVPHPLPSQVEYFWSARTHSCSIRNSLPQKLIRET